MIPSQSASAKPEAQKQVLRKALLRALDYLQLGRREFCAMTGLSLASASRFYEGSKLISPHSKEGELALLFLRVYRSLDTLFGGNQTQCRLWLQSHNYHLSGAPIELMAQIEGLTRVAAYLDAMRGKI